MYSGACQHFRAKPAPLTVAWPATRAHTSCTIRRHQRLRVFQPNHNSHWSPDDDNISSSRSNETAGSPWGAKNNIPTVSAAVQPISQQSLNMAFHLLDKNHDGLISRAEAYRMVAFYLALQQYKPPEPSAKPLTWDQHLIASIAAATKLSGGTAAATWAALEAFVAAKLSGGLQKSPPRCSDLVWAGLGMATAFVVLGVLAAAAKTLPVVGNWHQHGLPLLLGSFGTIAILLFGKPEADAVRLWPILAGQLGATAIAVGMIQIFGASLLTRACAMAATVMYMMWTDTIHPPGGALVLMSMDNIAIQQLQWAYMLWPSLLLCLGVMLPISATTNWLRRNQQFDWPGTGNPAATLQQKQKDYKEQQQKKADMMRRHTAMMLTERVTIPLSQFHAAAELSAQQKGTVFRLDGLSKAIAQYQAKQQLEKLWQQQQQQQQQQQMDDSKKKKDDGVMGNTGKYVADAGKFQSTAAAALDAAVKRRLKREAERKLEDDLYHKKLWGPAIKNFEHYERKLQKLHEDRLKQQQHQQQPGKPQFTTNQQQQQSKQEPVMQQSPGISADSNPFKPSVQDLSVTAGSRSGSRVSSRAGLVGRLSTYEDPAWQQQVLKQQQNLYSQRQQQQQQQQHKDSDKPAWMYRWRSDIATVPGVGDFGFVGPLDSFAPDDQPWQNQQC